MKKLFSTLLLLAVTFCAAAQTQMVRLTRFEGKDITGVRSSVGFEVEVHPADKSYAVVEIPVKYEDQLVFTIDDKGTVTVGLEGRRTKVTRSELRARIYIAQPLVRLEASSGSHIECMGPFEGDAVTIAANSGADITGLKLAAKNSVIVDCTSAGSLKGASIDSPLLRCEMGSSAGAEIVHNGAASVINLSSASGLTISGAADKSTITANSAASVHGENYNIKSAKLQGSSAAKIRVGTVEELDAHGSSASSIRYKGTPKVIAIETSSASSIRTY